VPAFDDKVTNSLNDDEILARLHFQLGTYLRDHGRNDAALRHLNTAAELAPFDFTISRASMPMRGIDPFGPEVYALYDRWNEVGQPYHGLAPQFSPPTTKVAFVLRLGPTSPSRGCGR
jgi:hypothetical protein